MPERHLTRNAARCLACEQIVESRHRHDFVSCGCGKISVDGGLDYLKRSGDPGSFEELSEYADGPRPARRMTNEEWEEQVIAVCLALAEMGK